VTFVIYTLQFSIFKDGTDALNNLRTNSHHSHKTAANSVCNLKRQHCDSYYLLLKKYAVVVIKLRYNFYYFAV